MINKNLPYFDKSHNDIIPSNAQFFNLTVGQRNSGKSATQERLLEELYLKKWGCVFDAWSAGFESLFYCLNMNCKEKRKNRIQEIEDEIRIKTARYETDSIQTLEDEIYKLKNELSCECFRRFPITILISEAIEINQKSLDTINGRYYTKSEYVTMMRAKGEVLVEYDDTNPPEKPISQRTEWIKVVKLPFPTKTDATEINDEIMNRFTDAVLSCRTNRRILCYVPSLFPTDYARYRTLAVIVTNLPKVTDKHFKPLYEHEVGLPKDQWSLEQKNHHRFCILLRELAELSPANMKTNEFANLTKRSILSIIYTSRHSRISILADVQKVESVFREVRTMTNTILIKRSTSSLLGDELKDVKKRIEANQERLFAKFGKSDEAQQFVYSKYPPLEKLNKNYCYVLYDDDWIEKWHIPNTMHHKKQEDDDFFKLTGFSYTVNEDMIKAQHQKKTAKIDESDKEEQELYDFINKLRNPKEGKGESWNNIKTMLIEQQSNGKFKKQDSFKNKDHNSIGKWFKRNFGKTQKND